MARLNSKRIQQIIKQFQRQQNEANAANEQRFADIVGARTGPGQFSGGLLASAGATALADAERRATRELASADQNLTSRGLGNTTIRSAVRRGILEDQSRAEERVREQVALGRAGVIERRTDVGPDIGQISSLVEAAAAAPGRISATIGGTPRSGGTGSGIGGGVGGGLSAGGGGTGAAGVQTFTNPNARRLNEAGLAAGIPTNRFGVPLSSVDPKFLEKPTKIVKGLQGPGGARFVSGTGQINRTGARPTGRSPFSSFLSSLLGVR